MPENDLLNFQELRDLKDLLVKYRSRHVDSLSAFFDERIPGFVNYREDLRKPPRDHMSLSSSSTCIVSLISTGSWSRRATDAPPWIALANKVEQKLKHQNWKSSGLEDDNLFSTAFAIEALVALEEVADPPHSNISDEKVKNGIEGLKSSIEKNGSVNLGTYPQSAFLTQLVWRVLKKTAKSDAYRDIRDRTSEWAWKEINRQIVLHKAKSKAADAFQLAYAIILAAETTDSANALPDFRLLLGHALQCLFGTQLEDGTWPRSQPLFHYPGVGNAYCYEYEMLTQLLGCQQLRDNCLQHQRSFARAAYALRESLFELEDGALAWASGHHPQKEGPESWATASVFHFVAQLERLLAESIRIALFKEVNAQYVPAATLKLRPATKFAPDFWDCSITVDRQPRSLKQVLASSFLAKISNELESVEQGRAFSKATPMSAILFGPPGTSKTELANEISKFLRWPKLTVDPSYFVKNGLDAIQAQAERLFEMLVYAEGIVVLFDEFDEMVRDRANAEEIFSRFLTTAMLPKLANINRSRRLVFIVATNYIDRFDLAISRPGRFDLILQVMPPTAEAKIANSPKLNQMLDSYGPEVKAAALTELEKLTFDEFKAALPKLHKCTSSTEFQKELESAIKRCTLQRVWNRNEGDKKTWAEVCKEQEGLISMRTGE